MTHRVGIGHEKAAVDGVEGNALGQQLQAVPGQHLDLQAHAVRRTRTASICSVGARLKPLRA